MGLETIAQVNKTFQGGPAFMEPESDFTHTLSFSQGGPLFNLPAGWTANSTDGAIVNNQFVPEPAFLSLFALAAPVILCRRRTNI
jgi:hypothetical protein